MCVRVCVCVTQEWGEPVDVSLTVRVEEGDDLSHSERCPQQSGPDQTLTLLSANNAHLLQPGHVLLQRGLQVFCPGRTHRLEVTLGLRMVWDWGVCTSVTEVVYEDDLGDEVRWRAVQNAVHGAQ